jgi:hypothetical protein
MAEEDKELKEAVEECAKIIEEKCRRHPYMIVVSKADVGFASEEDKKKGILRGKTSYMYFAKPPIKKDGMSKLLVDASRMALDLAEKTVKGEESTEQK